MQILLRKKKQKKKGKFLCNQHYTNNYKHFQCANITTNLKSSIHYPNCISCEYLFVDIDEKKTPKDSDSSDSSLPDIPPPKECSRPLCWSPRKKSKPDGSPNRHPTPKSPLGHSPKSPLRRSPRKHATTLKLLQQQNNVLHQQAKAKVQSPHNILTNSISTLHKIEMV